MHTETILKAIEAKRFDYASHKLKELRRVKDLLPEIDSLSKKYDGLCKEIDIVIAK